MVSISDDDCKLISEKDKKMRECSYSVQWEKKPSAENVGPRGGLGLQKNKKNLKELLNASSQRSE